METPIIRAQPPNNEDTYLKEKHLESISKQLELMEDIAKQMLTLELAIPGLYLSLINQRKSITFIFITALMLL